jgi:hypothetical protein
MTDEQIPEPKPTVWQKVNREILKGIFWVMWVNVVIWAVVGAFWFMNKFG